MSLAFGKTILQLDRGALDLQYSGAARQDRSCCWKLVGFVCFRGMAYETMPSSRKHRE